MLPPSAVVNQAKVVQVELARVDPEQRLVRPLLRRVRNVLTKVRPAATAKECASLDAAVGRTSLSFQKMRSAEDPSAVENLEEAVQMERPQAERARAELGQRLLRPMLRRQIVPWQERPAAMAKEYAVAVEAHG